MSYFTNVRYGKMRMVARFNTDRDELRVRDRCVVRTDRGKELGEVLTPLQPIPEAIPAESLWDVIRRANPEDLLNVDRVNKESVVLQRLASAHWEGELKRLVAEHARETGSAFATGLLRDWDRVRDQFWQVCPKEMISRLTHPLSDPVAEQELA